MSTSAEEPVAGAQDDRTVAAAEVPEHEASTWQERRRALGLSVQSRRLRWWWAAARRRPGLAVLFVGQVSAFPLMMRWHPGALMGNVVQAAVLLLTPLTLVGWRMRIAHTLEQDDERAERRQVRPPIAIRDPEDYPATLRWRSAKVGALATVLGFFAACGAFFFVLAVVVPRQGGPDGWIFTGIGLACLALGCGSVAWELRLIRRRLRTSHSVAARVLGFVPDGQYVVVESLDGVRRAVLQTFGHHALRAGDEVALLGELEPVDTQFAKKKRLPYALSGPFGTVWGGRLSHWLLPENLRPYQPQLDPEEKWSTVRAESQARGRPRAR